MAHRTIRRSPLGPLAQIVDQGSRERLDHAHALAAGEIQQLQGQRIFPAAVV
jgi:hypothetical protein